MKRKGNRLLALILSFCIVFSMSGVAYAEETAENSNNTEIVLDENENLEPIVEEDTAETTSGHEDTEVSTEVIEDVGITEEALVDTGDSEEAGQVLGVDKNGNVFTIEVEEGSGVVEEQMSRARTASTMIVNFAAYANGESASTKNPTEYTEYLTNKPGYVYGHAGADAAYLGTVNGKVKFMMSGVIGLVDASMVQVVKLSSVKSYSYYSGNGTRLYHHVATDMSTPGTAFSVDLGPQPSYIKTGTSYYSYDGHYFYTNYDQMLSDYSSDTRSNAVNASNPYYNYFQYLPLRSTTSYSSSTFNSMINARVNSTSQLYDTGALFVEKQNTYGVNAIIAASIGALESGWGTSSISKNKNNLFGWNAVDQTPGESANYFPSVADCIHEYTQIYLSQKYLRAGWTHYNGGFLGNKASGMNVKYASDPYWGEKIAAIAWSLDEANGKKDQYKYTIGIKDTVTYEHISLNVRKEATTSSTKLYSTGSASNYAFIILGESNGFYKVQSDPVLNSSRTAIADGVGEYNPSNMYAYASKDYIKVMLQGNSNGDSGNTDDSNGNSGNNSTVNTVGSVNYSAHVQDIGWQKSVKDGAVAGTTGKNKQVEALKISLSGSSYEGGIQYSTHVQDIGWQSNVKDGAIAGTTGKNLQVEAIKIQLTGKISEVCDVYYRVHSSEFGWLGWAKNGAAAGSEGYARQVEAIEIRLVKKGEAAPGSTTNAFMSKAGSTGNNSTNTGDTTKNASVKYLTHVENIGWQSHVKDGGLAGTTGRNLQLEALKITLPDKPYSGSVQYCTHVQDMGWLSYVRDGALAGTTGKNKAVEAVKIKLTGEMANKYDIYYRVHSSEFGWLGWAKNGAAAGSEGYARQVEAIEIKIVKKGASAPGSTAKCFYKK